MAQVAVSLVPHPSLSPSKAKQNLFFSYGRGGSGDRRSYVSTNGERSDGPSVTSARVRQGTSTSDKMQLPIQTARPEVPTERPGLERQHLTSSGRGGSGNIQPSTGTSDLEAHPLTASILSQHSAVQAQYEQRVRKVHAESNLVRSSGRGGSGNISGVRRSRSHGPSTAPKKRFFTTKGRERGTKCDVAQALDRQDRNTDRRTSQATYSSGGSSALDDQERCGSNPEASNGSVTSDPLSSEDAITGHPGKRHSLFSIRWSKLPSPTSPVTPPRSPTVPTYPRSLHTGAPSSRSGVHSYSSASVVLEDREYVSFLEF